ncbi:MAG: phytanoyl-CoA dioxygenase family protein [Pseudomonadales bacterium]|nr:phytanoyl-CoA dioxygenase family protein [Pseudomonadales bacterium]
MALRRVSATNELSEILTTLEEDRGLIVEGMFPEDVIATMREAILDHAQSFAAGAADQGLGEVGKYFVGANTIRFSTLGRVSPAYFELLDNPTYAALADAVLLPNCGSYWVNTGQAMLIGPNSQAQMLHRDCENWPSISAIDWPNGPEVTLSAMIALDEMTEELGATRVVPGSHRWSDRSRVAKPDESFPAEMQPGDALIYAGKLIHGGGANRTADQWRNAMHLSFVAGWLTPEESSPIDYSDEDLAGQSDRVQMLLGHRSYQPTKAGGGGLWLRHVKKIEEVSDVF